MFRHGFALVEAAYPGSTWLQDSFPEWIYRTEGIYPSERQKKQRERGIELVELAAKKDHADALYWLGLKGAKALTEEKDFHLFQRAVQADPDHSRALYELGKIYKIGWFPKIPDGRGGFTWGPRRGIDEEKSLRCYEQAAALGHGGALSELGEAYEYGHLGKEVNIETSIKYYEKSVEADPGPWADIIEKYGNVRTFVLGEERGEWTDTEDEDEIDIEDKATGSKGKGSDQSSSYGKCAGEDEADKDEVNSEDEASGSKGNGSEQSSPCRKCAGEDKGEGEGDSGESGPLVLIRKGTLVIDMTLATEDEKKSQRDWLARCYGADQPSPSASGQPSSTTSH